MKTAFITGGGRGIGKGFAEYFLREGYTIFIGVRDPSQVDAEFKNNKNLHVIRLDVSDDLSIQEAFSDVSQKTDRIDYLVNNAGLNKDSATQNHKELVCNLKDLSRSHLLTMFNLNAIAPMMVLKTFLPL